jgi:hypothetical protein
MYQTFTIIVLLKKTKWYVRHLFQLQFKNLFIDLYNANRVCLQKLSGIKGDQHEPDIFVNCYRKM